MEQVIMKKVLEDILDEQKITNADKQKLTEALEKLTEEIAGFNKKLLNVTLEVPEINTATIENLLRSHTSATQLAQSVYFRQLELLQKKKQFKEEIFYWLPWLIVICLCAIIFRIAVGGSFHGSIF